MAIDVSSLARRGAVWALGGWLALSALAQTPAPVSDAADAQRWFDGQAWVAAHPQQGPAQAAGGVVVMVAPSHAAALHAALMAKGLLPRPLPVAGAYQVDSAPGVAALALTHRLADLPGVVGAPVQIAPNWISPMRLR